MSNKQFKKTRKNLKGLTLDSLLDEVSVMDYWENQTNVLIGWYAVCTDLGIIAYFSSEREALRFRLDYINRILNS